MKTAVRAFELKASDDAARTFTGLAAAFSLDQGGDVILPGAFKRTLKDWKASKGKVIPLIDSHGRDSIRRVVGKMIDAEETAEGLEATFEVIDGPDGDEVHRRLKGGYVTGLSIGFELVAARLPTSAEREVYPGVERVLVELKLREVSVVVFPMNEEARVDADTIKLSSRERERAALVSAFSGEDLAPDHPRRLALEHRYRSLVIRDIEQRARFN